MVINKKHGRKHDLLSCPNHWIVHSVYYEPNIWCHFYLFILLFYGLIVKRVCVVHFTLFFISIYVSWPWWSLHLVLLCWRLKLVSVKCFLFGGLPWNFTTNQIPFLFLHVFVVNNVNLLGVSSFFHLVCVASYRFPAFLQIIVQTMKYIPAIGVINNITKNRDSRYWSKINKMHSS